MFACESRVGPAGKVIGEAAGWVWVTWRRAVRDTLRPVVAAAAYRVTVESFDRISTEAPDRGAPLPRHCVQCGCQEGGGYRLAWAAQSVTQSRPWPLPSGIFSRAQPVGPFDRLS